MTVAEVAEALGFSKATIYSLCESGDLPSFRIGNSIRLVADEVWKRLRQK